MVAIQPTSFVKDCYVRIVVGLSKFQRDLVVACKKMFCYFDISHIKELHLYCGIREWHQTLSFLTHLHDTDILGRGDGTCQGGSLGFEPATFCTEGERPNH